MFKMLNIFFELMMIHYIPRTFVQLMSRIYRSMKRAAANYFFMETENPP